MRTLRVLWSTWQHGAWLTLAYALGILSAAVCTALILAVPVLVLEALGYRIDEEALMLLASVAWVPYGIGIAARSINSDRLKPEGYIEPEGHYGRLARRIKEQG